MEATLGRALRFTLALLAATALTAGCSILRPETAPEPEAGAQPAAVEPGGAGAAAVSPGPPAEGEDGAAAAAGATLAGAAELDWRYAEFRVDALGDRRFSPEEYWEVLLPILEAAPDRFTVRQVGTSVQGRPIRRVDFGRGEVSVMLWSQMHGNESTASRSLVDIFRYLRDNATDPLVQRLEGTLAITVIPVLNPDGAARFVRHNAVGIDINRDARRLATPEGRALKAVRGEVDARWGFNLHDQNVRTRLGSSDRDVLIALLAPPPAQGQTSPANEAARRMCSLLSVALEPVVGDQVARYDESFNQRAFGDLMTAWGTSVVLIESGGELHDPHKERLRRANFVGILTALDAIASETWAQYGERRYFGLPLNAPWVFDLLVRGASVVLPGGEPVQADLAINFADTLLRDAGTIEEIGDLEEARALQEIDASGLFFLPDPELTATGEGRGLRPGDPATGVLARDPEGLDVVMQLLDGRVSEPR